MSGPDAGADQMDVQIPEFAVFQHEVCDCLPVNFEGWGQTGGSGGKLYVIHGEGVEVEFQEASSPSQWTFGARG